jgi:predicted DNA-binding mobile mystery protein A
MSSRLLRLSQLNQALAEPRPKAPAGGWVRAIREALGMSARQLAERMGASPTAALDLERREAAGTLSLGQLKRAAAALDCELTYVLVPRQPLDQMVEARARALATERVRRVTHAMRLEAQEPGPAYVDKQIEEETRATLQGSWNKLWQTK